MAQENIRDRDCQPTAGLASTYPQRGERLSSPFKHDKSPAVVGSLDQYYCYKSVPTKFPTMLVWRRSHTMEEKCFLIEIEPVQHLLVQTQITIL